MESKTPGQREYNVLNGVEELEQALQAYTLNPRLPHDRFVAVAVAEAIAAAREGNGGIGALLVDPHGEVVLRAHNQALAPYFRSDMHAEMSVLTRFEDQVQQRMQLKDYALFTSLEPCPMCVVRVSIAGAGSVFYAAPDAEGGMAACADRLPPVWAGLAGRIRFAPAACSPSLRELAQRAWLVTAAVRRTVIGLQK
jgi:tRNA(adenine34) deaminase